jgi:hypothetical protein
VLSNQVNDAVGTIVAGTDDNQLTTAARSRSPPRCSTAPGRPVATLYDQYRLPVTYDGIAQTMAPRSSPSRTAGSSPRRASIPARCCGRR